MKKALDDAFRTMMDGEADHLFSKAHLNSGVVQNKQQSKALDDVSRL
jgi:hypothetical protein